MYLRIEPEVFEPTANEETQNPANLETDEDLNNPGEVSGENE